MTDLADVRVVPGEELAVARAAAELLQASAASWDTLYVGHAAAEGRTVAGLMAFAERYGWISVVRARTAMVIDTTGPWEAYRERLPRGVRTLPRPAAAPAADGRPAGGAGAHRRGRRRRPRAA